MGDYLRYAMFDKYFKKIGTAPRRRCPAGTGKRQPSTTCCPGTTPGAAPTTRRPAGPGGSAPATPTSATRTRSRRGRCPPTPALTPKSPTGEDGLGDQPDAAAGVLPVAAVRRGRHRRWRDQQLGRRVRDAAGRYADLLRHGVRRGAGLPRPAVEPVVRHAGVVAWSASRSTTTRPGNAKAKAILDKWVAWALANTTVSGDGTCPDPVDPDLDRPARHLERGQPGRQHRPARHRRRATANDVGVAGACRRTLLPTTRPSPATPRPRPRPRGCSTPSGHEPGRQWASRSPETRTDYKRFDDLYVPAATASTSRRLDRQDAQRRRDQAGRRPSSTSAPSTRRTRTGRRSRPT